MNKFIKMGISLLTGVALFFALSSKDEKSSGQKTGNNGENKNYGNSQKNSNTFDDVIIDGHSDSNKRTVESTSSNLKTAQNVFNTISNAINTVLTILGNFSKLTNTRPQTDYVIYT